jgi:ABC-type Zn2+ transport system substrate-binding protein/surface adhesin
VVETRPHEHHNIHDDAEREGGEDGGFQRSADAHLWVEMDISDELTPRIVVTVRRAQSLEDGTGVFDKIEEPEEFAGAV